MSIEVVSSVREYPDESGPYDTLKIRSHWNFKDRIVLQINNEEKKRIFLAQDLIQAIQNATNAH